MSGTGVNKMKMAAEIVRKGGTILSEPCPQCGGIQVRYHGKIYCTNHEDLSSILRVENVSFDSVVAQMREVLVSKLNETTTVLEREKDAAAQEALVSLMAKYFDLLQKLPRK